MQFDDEMKGVLFPEFERESEKHPTDKGHCVIEGKKYWISSWKNTSQNGKAYRSLRFEPAIETGKDSQAWKQAREKFKKDDVAVVEGNEEINLDDIPF